MKGKIIQIIPAPNNLVIVSTVEGKIFEEPALCLALSDQGRVHIIHIDGAGLVDELNDAIDFDCIKWK